jgi:hypothetical protein
MSHEYKRHGTVTLMAGIDLLTGQVHAYRVPVTALSTQPKGITSSGPMMM